MEWISVEEKLPEWGEWCLTYRKGVFIKMFAYGMFYDADTRAYSLIGIGGITHWMPLPEPPK